LTRERFTTAADTAARAVLRAAGRESLLPEESSST
jgi:hypothetical protein